MISVAKSLGPALQPEAYFGSQPTAGKSAHFSPSLWQQHLSLMFLFPRTWTLDLKKRPPPQEEYKRVKGHCVRGRESFFLICFPPWSYKWEKGVSEFKSVFLKLEHGSQSPGGLPRTQIAESHLQSFWFRRSGGGPENLCIVQAPRCWRDPWSGTPLPSPPPPPAVGTTGLSNWPEVSGLLTMLWTDAHQHDSCRAIALCYMHSPASVLGWKSQAFRFLWPEFVFAHYRGKHPKPAVQGSQEREGLNKLFRLLIIVYYILKKNVFLLTQEGKTKQ